MPSPWRDSNAWPSCLEACDQLHQRISNLFQWIRSQVQPVSTKNQRAKYQQHEIFWACSCLWMPQLWNIFAWDLNLYQRNPTSEFWQIIAKFLFWWRKIYLDLSHLRFPFLLATVCPATTTTTTSTTSVTTTTRMTSTTAMTTKTMTTTTSTTTRWLGMCSAGNRQWQKQTPKSLKQEKAPIAKRNTSSLLEPVATKIFIHRFLDRVQQSSWVQ